MKAIVAVDKKWGIGKKNGLLFTLPEDMKFFRVTTLNKVCIMGYNTLLSFPESKPLKNRVNIVLAPDFVERDDVIIVHTLEELSRTLKNYNDGDVFVIGGAMFYKTMLDYCSEVFVTKVDADGGAEVFYPNLDEDDRFTLKEESQTVTTNGYDIKFTVYKNNQVKQF